MTQPAHTLSIICVALNEQPHIARLKRSIDALAPVDGVAVETILVDGGSRDGTVGEANTAGFHHVSVHPGAGIPVCRNLGARTARGDWLAYVDADCELAVDWLQQGAPFLSGGEPAVIGWPVLPPENSTWVQRAWQVHWSCKNRAARNADHQGAVSDQAFRLLTTRNLLLNREVFDALDGFDENLPTGEDSDFVFRASHRGLIVLGVPTLQVVHYGEPATLRAFYRQQLWHANRTSYQTVLREQDGRGGGNAPLFAALFFVLGLLGTTGLAAALWSRAWMPLLALLPWLGLIMGPAILIARRAGNLAYLFPLSLLYAAYGLAHALDLVGFHRTKTSWKS
jgi:glycosyltransferase involved in cell wall biosynthesis